MKLIIKDKESEEKEKESIFELKDDNTLKHIDLIINGRLVMWFKPNGDISFYREAFKSEGFNSPEEA